MFLHMSVSHSFHRHPLDRLPTGQTARLIRHPLGRHPPGQNPPSPMATAADGTHPNGMHSCSEDSLLPADSFSGSSKINIVCAFSYFLEPTKR